MKCTIRSITVIYCKERFC